METPLDMTLYRRAEKAGWKLGRSLMIRGVYYYKDGHPRCKDGGVIWDANELEKILDDERPNPSVSVHIRGLADMPQATQESLGKMCELAIDHMKAGKFDDEPLSNCCGAPALGEIHEGFAFCRDCREMAEFKEDGE